MKRLKLLIGLGMFMVLSSLCYGLIAHSGDIYTTTTTTNYNVTNNDTLFVNITGDIMTGNLNMSGNKLTDIGEIIMQGLVWSYDIIPITDNLYSIGNSTNWYAEAYIKDIYAVNINTTNLTSEFINSTKMDSENITLGGHEISLQSGNLVMVIQ